MILSGVFLGIFWQRTEWHKRYTPPPCRGPGCSYTPVAALSAVLSVSQLRPQRPRHTPSSTPVAQQNRVYPHHLGAGSARPNPKMGASYPEKPLFLGFSVLRGGLRPCLRPWSRNGPDHGVGVDPETMSSPYLGSCEGGGCSAATCEGFRG